MPPLRIAQIMASGPVIGGLEKHFIDLCGGLSAEHKVLAVADPFHSAGLREEVEFCPFNFSGSRRNPLALLRIHHLLKSFQPDIIHAQANKAAAMIAALRYFFRAKRVATVHGIKRSDRMFRSFHAVICVSSAVRDQLQMSSAQVIPNGIAPIERPAIDSQYLRKEFGLNGQRKICLAVGRLVKPKGFSNLIRAWQGIDADLIIAGEGTERPELEALIGSLRLNQSVHLVGFRSDIPALMVNADLVVISSEREGFPYGMVEALHLEKVIVSTRFPGVAALLPNQYLVPYGDENQLRERIQKTLGLLNQAKTEYRPVWQRAQSQLTVEQMVRRTAQVYAKVLGSIAYAYPFANLAVDHALLIA